jgi:RNA polymerase sigma-70 factor (ECF subfamily)
VTANLASSARKRRRVEVAALRRLPPPLVPIDSGLEDETFWELVRALPTRQRHAVVLFYLEDLPVDEIAAVLGCAANTAKAHLHKGRRRLERELTKQRAPS